MFKESVEFKISRLYNAYYLSINSERVHVVLLKNILFFTFLDSLSYFKMHILTDYLSILDVESVKFATVLHNAKGYSPPQKNKIKKYIYIFLISYSPALSWNTDLGEVIILLNIFFIYEYFITGKRQFLTWLYLSPSSKIIHILQYNPWGYQIDI